MNSSHRMSQRRGTGWTCQRSCGEGNIPEVGGKESAGPYLHLAPREMLTPTSADRKYSALYVNQDLCRLAVDLSRGSLIRIGIEHFADDSLLLYVAERSSQLKHLKLVCCFNISNEALASVAAKVPLLEELELSHCPPVSKEVVEAFGRCCLLLKSFKLKRLGNQFGCDDMARATGDNMLGLVHL